MKRRDFLKASSLTAASIMLPGCANLFSGKISSSKRPNILWIVSEDNGRFLGCYGDKFATTPNLDRLAAEGIRYENAYANAPVCAPARNTIITGMYPPAMGTQHMRSKNDMPAFVKFFTQYLRPTGYYCTNRSKEDYNTTKPKGAWDQSAKKAHYKNRHQVQPFFAVFNIGTSHESSLHYKKKNLDHDPADVTLPPYHPDTPEIRYDWAQYYDKMQQMDKKVAKRLDELKESGLEDDTIVFYYADHAGVLARSKRYLYDSGTHVPMIVRFGKNFRHLAPAKPGSVENRLVSFVDLAPTILSLAGLEVPDYMQGHAFLGPQKTPDPQYVYLFRDRMDERYDLSRAICDGKYKYIRNYNPHRIHGQHLGYLWRAPSTRSWENAYKQGKCNKTQSIFWQPKPSEELYDTNKDPHEVNNLAPDPQYRTTLRRMRKETSLWIRTIRDTGFIPEAHMVDQLQNQTAYQLTNDKDLPIDRIIETAELATDRNPKNLPTIKKRLRDNDPSVRYWAATGCIVLAKHASKVYDLLTERLTDSSASVRIAAAEALFKIARSDQAITTLTNELSSKNRWAALHAINVLTVIEKPAPVIKILKKLAQTSKDRYIRDAALYAAGLPDKRD